MTDQKGEGSVLLYLNQVSVNMTDQKGEGSVLLYLNQVAPDHALSRIRRGRALSVTPPQPGRTGPRFITDQKGEGSVLLHLNQVSVNMTDQKGDGLSVLYLNQVSVNMTDQKGKGSVLLYLNQVSVNMTDQKGEGSVLLYLNQVSVNMTDQKGEGSVLLYLNQVSVNMTDQKGEGSQCYSTSTRSHRTTLYHGSEGGGLSVLLHLNQVAPDHALSRIRRGRALSVTPPQPGRTGPRFITDQKGEGSQCYSTSTMSHRTTLYHGSEGGGLSVLLHLNQVAPDHALSRIRRGRALSVTPPQPGRTGPRFITDQKGEGSQCYSTSTRSHRTTLYHGSEGGGLSVLLHLNQVAPDHALSRIRRGRALSVTPPQPGRTVPRFITDQKGEGSQCYSTSTRSHRTTLYHGSEGGGLSVLLHLNQVAPDHALSRIRRGRALSVTPPQPGRTGPRFITDQKGEGSVLLHLNQVSVNMTDQKGEGSVLLYLNQVSVNMTDQKGKGSVLLYLNQVSVNMTDQKGEGSQCYSTSALT
ncbi:unnamed protein product [Arctogadus glacialis]